MRVAGRLFGREKVNLLYRFFVRKECCFVKLNFCRLSVGVYIAVRIEGFYLL